LNVAATILHADLEQSGPSVCKATVRAHTLFVDRLPAKGGTDRGPMGGEYLLVALGGCFSSHLLAAIRAREAAISDVHVAVSGTLDDSPGRFTAFDVAVSAACTDNDLLQKLVLIAERACQVIGTLKLAAPVRVTVTQRQAAAQDT
jgi:putative redox protein